MVSPHTTNITRSKLLAVVMLGIAGMLSVRNRCVAHESYVAFISETGMPHAAVLIAQDNEVRWLGFRPQERHQPVGPGMIDESSRQQLIETYVGFKIHSDVLQQAESRVRQKYANATYRLGVRDCVNLAADVARECGLRVKTVGNFVPAEFVLRLAQDNRSLVVDDNTRPFPWVANSKIGSQQLHVQVKQIICVKPESVLTPDNLFVRLFCTDGQRIISTEHFQVSRGQRFDPQVGLVTAAGNAIAIQVWDDDRIDPDDLVFDMSLPVKERTTHSLEQVRGNPLTGSESKYQVELVVEQITSN